ncbi:hypothetical protein HDU98_001523 [Podochytrium sp. JEL0797]|nr:hypothetical protein HDU98_001523 [Podochytrium sp. JEL0797]
MLSPAASPEAPAIDGTDVTGFCYCPPGWDEGRLRSGPDAEAIAQIAIETFTDIAYIKEKNAIQIIGETHEEVYAAQTKLNDIFFPVIVRSKKQWARPDRPGNWGQRRDNVAAPAGSAIRKMTSDLSLRQGYGAPSNNNYNNGYQQQQQQQQHQQSQPTQQFQQPWLQQQQMNQQQTQQNYYQNNAYQRPNSSMSHRSSVSDYNNNGNRHSFNGYAQHDDQPISPASPFARW